MKLYIKIPLIILNSLFVLACLFATYILSNQLFALIGYVLGIFTVLSILTLKRMLKRKSKKKSSTKIQEAQNLEEVPNLKQLPQFSDKPQPPLAEDFTHNLSLGLPEISKEKEWKQNEDGYLELK